MCLCAITNLDCKENICCKLALTKYPVTFDSVSIATTGSQCRDSVEPIIVHCMLCGARSGAKTSKINTVPICQSSFSQAFFS